MLEFNTDEKYEVKIDGNVIQLAKPTHAQILELRSTLRTDAGKEQDYELGAKLLADCGMPEEILKKLQPEHIGTIALALMGQKKA